ncbi:MAG TPA: hypothetical protein ENK55_11835 [Actinobacteria bacterium]|nr:hypothetical protein [Actinomycetota bacterium]
MIEIAGDPGPDVAAAIAAVIAHVELEEAASRSRPPTSPQQPAWVVWSRPREVPAPLPSHVYDARPWAIEPSVEPPTEA